MDLFFTVLCLNNWGIFYFLRERKEVGEESEFEYP